ncbi:MAG: hypothetical protein ACKVS6_05505 [Planctomycetota bacterium]
MPRISMFNKLTKSIFTILLVASAIAPFASAQGRKAMAEKPYADTRFGYQVTSFDKWTTVPPEPSERYLVMKFVSPSDIIDPKILVSHTPYFEILKFDPTGKSASLLDREEGNKEKDGPKTGDGPKSGEDSEPINMKDIQEKMAYKTFEQYLGKASGMQMMGKAETKKFGKLSAKVYNFKEVTSFKLFIRHYAVAFTNDKKEEIVLHYSIMERAFEEWKELFDRSVLSFKFIKVDEKKDSDLDAMTPLQRSEAVHKEDCARTGWRFEKTEHYFIKFSIDNDKFVKECKERIEAIRKVFVKEFGDRELTEYPVVRICKNFDEYGNYGGPGGSAGYFNSHSKELVMPSLKDYDVKWTWAVMNHEAFHQFIWFRCGELAPHSWYNEGTGDYFAGFKYRGNNSFEIGTVGPSLLLIDRVTPVREALKKGELAPLDKLIRFTQQDYYAKGDIYYPQGWSFIYFLREAKKMGHKPFKPEWGNILKVYFDTMVETKDADKAVEVAFRDLKGDAMAELEKSYLLFIKDLK